MTYRPLKTYAAWINDSEIRRQSTSGGAFTSLARHVFSKGGIVVGAAYDGNLAIRHIVAKNETDLSKMRGVKYAKGTIDRSVYHEIKENISAGNIVLFVGLPCQVAAMRKMFGATPKLIAVDLACFGAPPGRLWRNYVSWLEGKEGRKLAYIDPRDKAHGWGRRTYYRYDWCDGEHQTKLSLFDPYAQMFYSGIAFSRPCYQCRFKGEGCAADITICDCWGAPDLGIGQECDVRLGVSAIIIRTRLGQEIFDSLSDLSRREIKYGDILRHNQPLESSAKAHQDADSFAADVSKLTFGELVQKYRMQKSRIAYAYGIAVSLLLRPLMQLIGIIRNG